MRTDLRHSSPSLQLRSGIYAILDLGIVRRRALEPVRVARKLCRAGIVALQLRGKDAFAAECLTLARRLAPVCRRAGVPFVVNDRADIAVLAGADGVHVGREDVPPAAARLLLPHGLVGFSTHSAAEIRASRRHPVDYVGLGPVFATTTKREADPTLGLARFRRIACGSPHPVVAIGGIGIGDVAAVRRAGAHAIALASALLSHGDPGALAVAAVREFERASDQPASERYNSS